MSGDLFMRLVTQVQGTSPAACPLIPSRYEPSYQSLRERADADQTDSSRETASQTEFGEQLPQLHPTMAVRDARIGAAPAENASTTMEEARAAILPGPLLSTVETRRITEPLPPQAAAPTHRHENRQPNGEDHAREVRQPNFRDTISAAFERLPQRRVPVFHQDAIGKPHLRTLTDRVETDKQPPPVQVRIGRIEVRLARQDQAPRNEGRSRGVGNGSLEEYLKKRSEGRL